MRNTTRNLQKRRRLQQIEKKLKREAKLRKKQGRSAAAAKT